MRVALIAFGAFQDAHSHLAYTDVDYTVFNDGARAIVSGCPLSKTVESSLYSSDADLNEVPELAGVHCARGIAPSVSRFVLVNDPYRTDMPDSWMSTAVSFSYTLTRPLFKLFAVIGDPYARDTYRYTPLLSVILAPSHLVPYAWIYAGKVLFAAADIGCALLMWRILDIRAIRYGKMYPAITGAAVTHLPGILWLLNPFPAQIATRGSSDSLVGLVLLAFLSLILRATPETALVDDNDFRGQEMKSGENDGAEPKPKMQRYQPWELGVVDELAFHTSAVLLALAAHLKLYPIIYGASILAHLANYRRHALAVMCGITKPKLYDVHELGFQFTCMSALAYFLMNFVAWFIWGQPFIDNALLYHLIRSDHRHNFSAYFLPIYLGIDNGESQGALTQVFLKVINSPIFSFLPQLGTVAAVGFALGGSDLILSCFVQTVVFVAWNKVYTSQYFLWYLWFVPIIGVTMRFRSRWHVALIIAVWAGFQALWLYHAYQLEFLARDTFVPLWLSGLALLVAQAWVAVTLVNAWSRWRIEQRAARSKAVKRE